MHRGFSQAQMQRRMAMLLKLSVKGGKSGEDCSGVVYHLPSPKQCLLERDARPSLGVGQAIPAVAASSGSYGRRQTDRNKLGRYPVPPRSLQARPEDLN